MDSFVTSDYHFGSWKGLSCFQVMSRKQEEDAIAKWNSIVKHGDLVYYLGDFCDGSIIDCIHYREMLNGDIILVKGNHDNFPDEISQALFSQVTDKIDVDGICMRHCPDLEAPGKQMFGHVHRDGIADPFFLDNGLCVCATMHSGMPIKLEDAIEAISTRHLQVSPKMI